MHRRRVLLVTALAAATAVSSFGVVATRHHVRMEFMRSEALLEEQDVLHTRWESLQLEHGALRAEGRVETLAKTELGMKTPESGEVVNVIVREGQVR